MLDWLKSKHDDEPRIKGFDVGKRIFTGAFSNIYKALHKQSDQVVALKILTPAGSRIAALLKKHPKTLWEGELLSVLDHENIVNCVDYSKKPPFWLAMAFVESALGSYVGRCHNVEEENDILRILGQLTSALDYLHSKGLVHRDLCMSNILVTKEGELKLIDFGLAVPSDSSVTRGRAGTPSYMAPEMIRKWRHTETTDIYSFGVIMYELLTGIKPFKGFLREQRMNRSLNVNPAPPSKLGRFCSADSEALLMKCLSKDPADRFGSTGELDKAIFVLQRKHGLV